MTIVCFVIGLVQSARVETFLLYAPLISMDSWEGVDQTRLLLITPAN